MSAVDPLYPETALGLWVHFSSQCLESGEEDSRVYVPNYAQKGNPCVVELQWGHHACLGDCTFIPIQT